MIPRLSPDALRADVAEMLRPRVARLGYLGEFFTCAAHQPAALLSFMAFTDDLKRALPERLTEAVALTVATELGNAYERHQHERLSLTLGFGEAWIRAVMALQPDGAQPVPAEAPEARRRQGRDREADSPARPELSGAERRVQALTLAILRRNGHGTSGEFESVVASIGHEQAIAVLMLIGRYVTHALMVNCLELKPPVASPLENT
jgi:alkylhydroperoxidase family enzyme